MHEGRTGSFPADYVHPILGPPTEAAIEVKQNEIKEKKSCLSTTTFVYSNLVAALSRNDRRDQRLQSNNPKYVLAETEKKTAIDFFSRKPDCKEREFQESSRKRNPIDAARRQGDDVRGLYDRADDDSFSGSGNRRRRRRFSDRRRRRRSDDGSLFDDGIREGVLSSRQVRNAAQGRRFDSRHAEARWHATSDVRTRHGQVETKGIVVLVEFGRSGEVWQGEKRVGFFDVK